MRETYKYLYSGSSMSLNYIFAKGNPHFLEMFLSEMIDSHLSDLHHGYVLSSDSLKNLRDASIGITDVEVPRVLSPISRWKEEVSHLRNYTTNEFVWYSQFMGFVGYELEELHLTIMRVTEDVRNRPEKVTIKPWELLQGSAWHLEQGIPEEHNPPEDYPLFDGFER